MLYSAKSLIESVRNQVGQNQIQCYQRKSSGLFDTYSFRFLPYRFVARLVQKIMTFPCQTFYDANYYPFSGTIAAPPNKRIHKTKLLHQCHVPIHAIQIVAETIQFYLFTLAFFNSEENFPHKIHISFHWKLPFCKCVATLPRPCNAAACRPERRIARPAMFRQRSLPRPARAAVRPDRASAWAESRMPPGTHPFNRTDGRFVNPRFRRSTSAPADSSAASAPTGNGARHSLPGSAGLRTTASTWTVPMRALRFRPWGSIIARSARPALTGGAGPHMFHP